MEVSTCGVTSTRGPLCVAISLLGVPVSALVICWSQGLALSDSGLDQHFGCGSTSDVLKFRGDPRKTLKLAVFVLSSAVSLRSPTSLIST